MQIFKSASMVLDLGSGIKLQAASLTVTEGYYRINLERNKYGYSTIKKNSGCYRRDPATGEEGHGTT